MAIRFASLQELEHGNADETAGDLPVGSVEFVRAAARRLGVSLPDFEAYPQALRRFLHRAVRPGILNDAQSTRSVLFVRPMRAIKAFTGFVSTDPPLSLMDPRLEGADPTTAVWFCTPVSWLCEWRYYIVDNQVLGAGRYDPEGADDAPDPDPQQVQAMVAAFGPCAPAGYALDVGVLSTGQTALIEVNDGWALGHYKGTCSPADYLRLLQARWEELCGQSKT